MEQALHLRRRLRRRTRSKSQSGRALDYRSQFPSWSATELGYRPCVQRGPQIVNLCGGKPPPLQKKRGMPSGGGRSPPRAKQNPPCPIGQCGTLRVGLRMKTTKDMMRIRVNRTSPSGSQSGVKSDLRTIVQKGAAVPGRNLSLGANGAVFVVPPGREFLRVLQSVERFIGAVRGELSSLRRA